MPITNIGITEPGKQAYIKYNDGFGNWVALMVILDDVRLFTPVDAVSHLNSVVVTSVAQLLLGEFVTLGEPVQILDGKSPEDTVSSFPILKRSQALSSGFRLE